MEIFVGIVVLILLGMMACMLFSAFKDGFYFLSHHLGLQRMMIKQADEERMEGYLQNFKYFSALSAEGKKKFLDRLFTFMLNKEFKGRNGLVITEQMKVLVSASAVQLTYGLKRYKLENLETIFLYPDTFFLHKRSPEYKGATKLSLMHLSWKDFEKGYARADDSLNLGLHEMTHALHLNLNIGYRYDSVFADRFEYWENLVKQKLAQSGSQRNTFLRSYSLANKDEFFAVCVEAYFENPETFKKELPEVYHLLCFLLNQDVLNRQADYARTPNEFDTGKFNIPDAEKVKRSFKYTTNHWAFYILAVGGIAFLPTLFFLINSLMIPLWALLLILFVLGSIGLMQKRYLEERNVLSGQFFVLYAYAGFGALLFSLILWANFLLPVSDLKKEKYVMTGYYAEYSYRKRGGKRLVGYRVELEDESSLNYSVLTLRRAPPIGAKYLVFEYRYGIFGIRKAESYHYTGEEKW